MTENEAIEKLQNSIDLAKMCTQNYERKREIQGYEMAIEALKEVQQYKKHGITVESALNNMRDLAAAENLIEEYRAIGTLEELKAAMKYVYLAKRHGTVGQVIENCVKYEEIGTPEEFQEAMEKKQNPITPIKEIIMKKYNEPYPTIEDLIKKKDYDYVSYRIACKEDKDGIFAGCFAVKNGHIIALDGDCYGIHTRVIASEEWSDPEEHIKNGLTIIVRGKN